MSDTDSGDIRPGDSIKISKGTWRDKEGVVEAVEDDGIWVSLRVKLGPSFVAKTPAVEAGRPARKARSRGGPVTRVTGPVVPPSEVPPCHPIRIEEKQLARFVRVSEDGSKYYAMIWVDDGTGTGKCIEFEFDSEKHKIRLTDETVPC